MIKLIVFDFDGTIADSKKIIFQIIKNGLLSERIKVDSKKMQTTMGSAPLEITLREFGIKDDKLEVTVKKIREEFLKNLNKIKPMKNIEVIRGLNKKTLVLTNNVSTIQKKLVASWKMKFFNEIYGAGEFTNKYEKFIEVIKRENLKLNEVVYIGDKPHDVDLAKKVGCISVAISAKSSWSTKKEILDSKPDYIISNWKQFPKIIKKLDSN